MLRAGLFRGFPGLEEVKSESIKEGTRYLSRVFQSTPQLLQGNGIWKHDEYVTTCCNFLSVEVQSYMDMGYGPVYPSFSQNPVYNVSGALCV